MSDHDFDEFPRLSDWRVILVGAIVFASTFGASFLLDVLRAAAP